MKICLLLLLLTILSCDNNSKCNKNINNLKIIRKDGLFHYEYGSTSKDSVLIYEPNCQLVEKNIFKDNLNISKINFTRYLKKGVRNYFTDKDYPQRKLYIVPKNKAILETFNINSEKKLNRYWKFKANFEVDTLRSHFFELEFPDTVLLNERTYGNINFHLAKKPDSLDIFEDYNPIIIVGKNFNDNFSNDKNIKTDTFLTKKNRFVTTFDKKGESRLKIKILDNYYFNDKDEKAIVEGRDYYFINKKVFVKAK